MYRNAMTKLIEWKNDLSRKPLIVNGARQVGKTWLVREFATEQFESIAHIIFLDNEEMQRLFESTLDPDRLLTIIGASTGTNPQDGKTLIFFDEIQECPRAITSLKFFCEQRPDVPLVAAGSLLGLAFNRADKDGDHKVSWPVGKVNYLDLHPMTFDEFVREVANPQLADLCTQADPETFKVFADRLSELLRAYLYVGGMPEAVQKYSDTGDFSAVREIQQTLLRDYEHDFAKHVQRPIDTERIRQTWHSVPQQLAREGDIRRFVFAAVSDGGRGRNYRDAIAWLVDSGLVTKVNRVTKPNLPLAAYADETYFKLYMLDVGLLGAAIGLDARTIFEQDRLFTEYKGVYAEQYVCQQLVANACLPYYWSADGKYQKGELDFLIEFAGKLWPIEVKAAANVAGASLSSFVKHYSLDKALRISMLPWKDQDWLLNIPLYAANCLPTCLSLDQDQTKSSI